MPKFNTIYDRSEPILEHPEGEPLTSQEFNISTQQKLMEFLVNGRTLNTQYDGYDEPDDDLECDNAGDISEYEPDTLYDAINGVLAKASSANEKQAKRATSKQETSSIEPVSQDEQSEDENIDQE